jgi:hypothetical protein
MPNPYPLKYLISKLFDPLQAGGDLVYFDGTKWNRLARGSDNQVLSLSSGLPIWVANIPSNLNFATQASGDIIYYNGSAWVVLHKGTDNQILQLIAGLPTWQNQGTFTAQTPITIGGVTDTLEHFIISSM